MIKPSEAKVRIQLVRKGLSVAETRKSKDVRVVVLSRNIFSLLDQRL